MHSDLPLEQGIDFPGVHGLSLSLSLWKPRDALGGDSRAALPTKPNSCPFLPQEFHLSCPSAPHGAGREGRVSITQLQLSPATGFCSVVAEL